MPPAVRGSEHVKHAHRPWPWVPWVPERPGPAAKAPKQGPCPPDPPRGPCRWLRDPHSHGRAKRRRASASLGRTPSGASHEVPGDSACWPQLRGCSGTPTPRPATRQPVASEVAHETRNRAEGYRLQRQWRCHRPPGLGTPVWEGPRLGTSPSHAQKFSSSRVMSLQAAQLLTLLQLGVPTTQ